ncbi:MAG: hypothetical protein IT458_11280 [Planctomycetes bacterium]|nr:hypothetical protein [Planctomycetota bacterium]
MLLKRIEAKTISEALAKVRKECGERALVIETRPTPGGYQVIAARPDANAAAPVRPGAAAERRWKRAFARFAEAGLRAGLGVNLLAAVEDALLGTRIDLEREGDPALPRVCGRILRGLIRTEPFGLPRFKVTALVGATGVGKTTTLAKLASRALHQEGESVAILTLDTWRIAAVEQLRAYADMLGVPCEVAFTPADLRRLAQRHGDKDRILIDTTGRSPHDRAALDALRGALGATEAAALLCLPAGLRRADAVAQLRAFEPLGVRAAVLTKWDETEVPGEALSLLVEDGLPISHVTVGQRVPEDLIVADAALLAGSLLDLEPATVEAIL